MTAPGDARLRLAWVLVALAAMFVVLAVSGVTYTNHVQRQAEQRFRAEQRKTEERFRQQKQRSDRLWCALLTTVESAPVPPERRADETARKAREQMHALRLELCGGGR